MTDKDHVLQLLKSMLGNNTEFRPGQWEAIEAVAINKQRALVVQRTGWGKSMVYFLATKILREQGAGPTLLISPLLSLMRNQIEAAEKFGLKAQTINCENQQAWAEINKQLIDNKCDLLLISPERLNNPEFREKVLLSISGKIGMMVVDEAHCISDWGHDFRPDYRRIVRIITMLPHGIPVLGTTATANDRVVADIQAQLGSKLLILRGPLDRESLRLQSIRLPSRAERLAWLAHNLNKFPGSGIIYCLTQADTELVADWLSKKGYLAKAYHAGLDGGEARSAIEQEFLTNQVKIIVATIALGMGFDKPDIGFVIHFQCPGSVVAYYQQVGRAGRAIDKSYGILLAGEEDTKIQEYFIKTAFPEPQTFHNVLKTLEGSEGLSFYDILDQVNISSTMAHKVLKILEIDGAVGLDKNKYFRTPNSWRYDEQRIELVLALRNFELKEIQRYVDEGKCSMKFLLNALNDPYAKNCGRCANCKTQGLSSKVPESLLEEATIFLNNIPIVIDPKIKAPNGFLGPKNGKIPEIYRNQPGRALSNYGEAGWGAMVVSDKYKSGKFSEELVRASIKLILDNWHLDPFPEWVCWVPSNRHPYLVPDFAKAIAAELGVPFFPALRKTSESPEQKMMLNSSMQLQNVIKSLGVVGTIPSGPVLLIDDIIDSGWTLTVAGYLLRKAGSGVVYPYVLTKATGRTR